MNRLTVIGRIVRDTELKEIGDGRIVMNNTIAIPRIFKSDHGQDADFINFVAWGKRAELIEEYCNKGDLIALDGRIQSRSYENDQKQTIYTVEMNVESVQFLQTRRNQKAAKTTQQQQSQTTTQNNKQTQSQPSGTSTDNEVDIDHIQTANH